MNLPFIFEIYLMVFFLSCTIGAFIAPSQDKSGIVDSSARTGSLILAIGNAIFFSIITIFFIYYSVTYSKDEKEWSERVYLPSALSNSKIMYTIYAVLLSIMVIFNIAIFAIFINPKFTNGFVANYMGFCLFLSVVSILVMIGYFYYIYNYEEETSLQETRPVEAQEAQQHAQLPGSGTPDGSNQTLQRATRTLGGL